MAAALVISFGFAVWATLAHAGVAKGPYVAKNEELFATIPTYPGVRLKQESSGALSTGEGYQPPPKHYYTVRLYSFARSSSCPAVERFYRHRLGASGWKVRLWAGDTGPERGLAESHEIYYRRGNASVRVYCGDATPTARGRFGVQLDHNYFG